MAKQTEKGKAGRDEVLAAAISVLRRDGAYATTVDKVAKEAGCAKGLVHYHFKTKDKLLAEATRELHELRGRSWRKALGAKTANSAITGTWSVLCSEADDGTLKAVTTLMAYGSTEVDRTVSQVRTAFADTLAGGALSVLTSLGLVPTVPRVEIGWLLAAVVDGMALNLLGGGDRSDLEGAYAAAWLGLLSLARQEI